VGPSRVFQARFLQPLLLGACGLTALWGCAEPTKSVSADPTRAMTPVPSCVRRLPKKASSGFARQIPEKDYWGLVVPDAQNHLESVNATTLDCAGEHVFASPLFEGATVDGSAVDEGRITYGGGVNRLRVVWLRSHQTQEKTSAGPLALVRVLDDYVEVYGVGAYKGEPEKSRFGLERLGGELVVTAVSDGCAGANPQGSCDTTLHVYRPVAGRLDTLAEIGLERVRHASGIEPGITGDLRFKLTSSPEFKKDGIHVIEEVAVTDEAGHTVRKAELERAFLLDRSKVNATAESLWQRLYEERVAPTKTGKAAPASETEKAPSVPQAPAAAPPSETTPGASKIRRDL